MVALGQLLEGLPNFFTTLLLGQDLGGRFGISHPQLQEATIRLVQPLVASYLFGNRSLPGTEMPSCGINQPLDSQAT